MTRKMELDQNKLDVYRIAARRVQKAGYPLTKDRLWDEYVTIAMQSGMRGLLDKHRIEPYLELLGKNDEYVGGTSERGE